MFLGYTELVEVIVLLCKYHSTLLQDMQYVFKQGPMLYSLYYSMDNSSIIVAFLLRVDTAAKEERSQIVVCLVTKKPNSSQ